MNLTKTLLATCLLAATTLPLTAMAVEEEATPEQAAATTGAGWYAADQWAQRNIYSGGLVSTSLDIASNQVKNPVLSTTLSVGSAVTTPQYYNGARDFGGRVYDWTHR